VPARWGEGVGAPSPGVDADSHHVSSGAQGTSSASAAVDGGRSAGQQDT